MSKYYLVATYKDNNNIEFGEEKFESVNGTILEKLEDIDKFTSSITEDEIFNILNAMGIKGKNKLFIKYYRTKEDEKNDKYKRYEVIVGNGLYYDAIQNMKKVSYSIPNRKIETLVVDKNSKLFNNELKVLEIILKNKDIDEFMKIYPFDPNNHNQFSSLVDRYFNTSKERDYQMIINDFSRYKVFRDWIVGRKGLMEQNISVSEEKYEQYYQKKNNNTYSYSKMQEHNLAYLDFDKEEFLDEEEVNDMYSKKRRR